MRHRFAMSLVTFVVPFVLVGLACDSASDGGSATLPDAQQPALEAGATDSPVTDPPDTSMPDTSPPDAGTDASTDTGADAAVTTLPFATGLGANGATLPDGQIDPHWTVKDSLGAPLTAYVQTDALGYVGYWMQPTPTSKFISPFVDTVDPTNNGTFLYTTTFVLGSEVVLANVKLVIRYASDNAMSAVTLNGQALAGVNAGSYSTFETLTVMTPFVFGTNTLTFTVANQGGPTGMRVELDLTK